MWTGAGPLADAAPGPTSPRGVAGRGVRVPAVPVHPVLRGAGDLPPGGEDVEVGGGLVDGQHLVERVQLVEGHLAPGPAETAGHGVGVEVAVAEDGQGLGEPVVV